MKYCPKCKELAFDDSAECAMCRTPLVSLSGSGSTTAGAGPEARTRLPPATRPADGEDEGHEAVSSPQGVQHLRLLIPQVAAQKAKNRRVSRALIGVCAAAGISILVTLYVLYSVTVLSYAELGNVEVKQNPVLPNRIHFSFDVIKKGKVRFVNRSGRHCAEKLDRYTQLKTETMFWAWNYDPAAGIDFRIRYRRGLFPVSVKKHFVTGK